MDIADLVAVLRDVQAACREREFRSLYADLIEALEQARSAPSPEVSETIQALRENLKAAHEAAQPRSWSRGRMDLFARFGAAELIGDAAACEIEAIFTRHQLDPGGAANALQQIQGRAAELELRVDHLVEALGPLAEGETGGAEAGGEAALKVMFEGDAAIGTIRELEERARVWRFAFASFAPMVRESADDATLRAVEQGPLSFTLAGSPALVTAVAQACCKLLEAIEKTLEIKRVALEVKHLGLQSAAVGVQMDVEAGSLVKDSVDGIVDDLMQAHRWRPTHDDDYNTVRNELRLAFDPLCEFLESGGRVDAGGEEQAAALGRNLGAVYEKIRLTRVAIEKLETTGS